MNVNGGKGLWHDGKMVNRGGVCECESVRGGSGCSIPKGLCPPAQGCEERATLGHRSTNILYRNAVAAIPFSFGARVKTATTPLGL
jgi:hypothetical protein